MKRIMILLFIAILSFSCGSKTKPGSGNNKEDTGTGPSQLELGDFKPIDDALKNIENNYTASDWSSQPVLKDLKVLEKGYLITSSKQGVTFIVVLGITDKGNVNIGMTSDLTKGADAIKAAGDPANWDPRKYIFNENGDRDGNVKIVWSSRGCTSDPAISNSFRNFTEYDAEYGHIFPAGYVGEKTFGTIGSYTVQKFPASLGDQEKEFGMKPVAYIYENANASGKRKAWFWWGGNQVVGSNREGEVSFYKTAAIRFGYGSDNTAVTEYPTKRGGSYGTALAKISDSGEPANRNSAPDGKGMFIRWHEKGIKNQVNFLGTMVGYNIRMIDMTETEIETTFKFDTTKVKDIKKVLIEFDATSFDDAKRDGFTHSTDLPGNDVINIGGNEAGLSGGNNTIKMPFIFFKSIED